MTKPKPQQLATCYSFNSKQQKMENSLEKDPDAIKLFIGQIPKSYTDVDLRQLFSIYGAIYELTILREKNTNAHRGCAFLTFVHRESAEEAMQELHGNRVLPGMSHAIQVKPADSEGKAEERKLFIGMIPHSYKEEDIKPMFEKYGTIEELNILKKPDGNSKGCAFLRYATKHQARTAISEKHHSVTLQGCTQPMVVKIADTEKEKERKKMEKVQQTPQMGVNFALGNPLGLYPVSEALKQQNLIIQAIATQGANAGLPGLGGMGFPKIGDNTLTTGLGIPQPQTPQQPAPGLLSATVGLQQPQQQGFPAPTSLGHQAYFPQPQQPQFQRELANALSYGQPQPQLPQVGMTGLMQQQTAQTQLSYIKPKEGPEGCNLFVYHIPTNLTDADLSQLFSPYGNVVSVKVFIDKATQRSRGFGFVSYDSPQCAQLAIQHMHGFEISGKRLKVNLKKKTNFKPY